MTHNIETVSDRNGLGMSSRGSVPCVDDPSLYRSYANRPVLQILDLEDSGNEVEILFRHDAIMIAPWDTKRRVLITREDLFAFRELLREIPEEAFVRPADPVEESFCVLDTDGDWWAINPDGRWEFVLGSNGHHYGFSGVATFVGSDEASFLAEINDTPRPVAPWEDGDTIVRTSLNTTFTYTRVNGKWQRVVLRAEHAGRPSYTDDILQHDADMDRLSDSANYRVLRRGGKVVS